MRRRQQEKTQQTQTELLDAAQRLFEEKGFFATTIAEITARAGYAKGSFYRHWAGKDELILQLVEQKLAAYRARRAERLQSARSLEEALDAVWDFLDSIVDDRNWSRVFLEFTIHASRDERLKAELAKRIYRLSDAMFADIVGGYVPQGYPAEKMGALNTALFEGFLIHSILGTGTLQTRDVRLAARALALALKDGSEQEPATATESSSGG